jgi:hypothetical protein
MLSDAVEPASADGTDACWAEAVTVRQLAINAAAAQPRASHADRPMLVLDAEGGRLDAGNLPRPGSGVQGPGWPGTCL